MVKNTSILIKSKQYVREYQLSFNSRATVVDLKKERETQVLLRKQYDCMIVNNKVDL